MKVKELILLLQCLPTDADVLVDGVPLARVGYIPATMDTDPVATIERKRPAISDQSIVDFMRACTDLGRESTSFDDAAHARFESERAPPK